MKGFISLCMIVKNEEKVIRRCLESVKGLVDEIIVVDTGSTDKTLEIVQEYTNKVFEYEWTNDFAAARNFAQSKATSEWILVMDADEYVDRMNLEEVINELKSNEQQFDAYNLYIYNFTGLSGENIIRHISVRIYKNQSDISYFRAIHEQVTKKDGELSIGFANLILYHSGYLNKTMKEKNKNERNLSLIEKEVTHSGQTAFDYFNLGNEYNSYGNHEKALECYVNAYKLKPDFRYSWVSFCVIQIINSLINLERYADGLAVLYDAEKIYANSPDLKYLKALIYSLQNRFDDAKQELNHLLKNTNNYQSVITSVHFLDYYPNKLMGEILDRQKQYQEATNYFINALNYNQSSVPVLGAFLKIAMKYSSKAEIVNFIDRMDFVHHPHDFRAMIKLLLNQPDGKTVVENYLGKIDEEQHLGIFLKNDLVSGDIEKAFNSLSSMDVKELERVLNVGYFDFLDFLILCLEGNELEFLYSVAKTFNELEGFIHFICGHAIEDLPEENHYLLLLDRCINLRKFDLFEKLLERKESFGEKINLKIGHLLYNHDFTDLAVLHYETLGLDQFDSIAFANITSIFRTAGDFDNGLSFVLQALGEGYNDFSLYHLGIDLLTQKEAFEDREELLKLANQHFPDSLWLNAFTGESVDFDEVFNGIDDMLDEMDSQVQMSVTDANKITQSPLHLQNVKHFKGDGTEGGSLLSIVIPAYKAEKYIRETIESALEQTIENKEIIIVNDGSPDNTLSIINEYAGIPEVRIFDNGINRGANYTYNYGLLQAAGKYVTFLDADDIYLPTYCEKVINKIEENDADFGFANLFALNGREKLQTTLYGMPRDPRFRNNFGGPDQSLPEHATLRKFVLQGVHISPRSVYKRELFLCYGLEDSRLRITHDWLRHIRFVINNAKCVFVDEALGYYRIHPEGNSQKSSFDNAVENVKLMEIVEKELSHLMTSEEKQIAINVKKEIRKSLFHSLAVSDLPSSEIVQFLINKGLHI